MCELYNIPNRHPCDILTAPRIRDCQSRRPYLDPHHPLATDHESYSPAIKNQKIYYALGKSNALNDARLIPASLRTSRLSIIDIVAVRVLVHTLVLASHSRIPVV